MVVLTAVSEGVKPQHRGLRLSWHRGEPHAERVAGGLACAEHPDVGRSQALSFVVRCVLPKLAESYEVSIGIEHHHAQLRAEQELLEDDPKRIRLTGAALAAKERMPSEPLATQPGGHVDPRRAPGA